MTDGPSHETRQVDSGVARPDLPSLQEPSQRPQQAIAPSMEKDGSAGAEDAAALVPSCVPEAGTDEPDDEHTDSNCDGIDGDRSRAVFVATTGSDQNAGTDSSPMKTLGAAITLAEKTNKAVYVCDGVYEEQVEIDGVVQVYGGYDCENGWARHLSHAVLAPAAGVPLRVHGDHAIVLVDRLALRASDGRDPSESSIAASVYDSATARLVHVALLAGNGADGTAGKPGSVVLPAAPPSSPGGDVLDADHCTAVNSGDGPSLQSSPGCGNLAPGGRGSLLICPGGWVTYGGSGGHGANFALGADAEEGAPGFPLRGWTTTGTGAIGKDGVVGGSFGSIDAGAYQASSGGHGAFGLPGAPGRGGRGGLSAPSGTAPSHTYLVGAGGGQGGYPGCGGDGGEPGTGGGASIGVIVDHARVTLDRCDVETNRGGKGGDGGEGIPGAAGGQGASGGASTRDVAHGDPGEPGGAGGRGGPGGPGGGGPSIGIVVVGGVPLVRGTTFTLGTPGRGGTSSRTTGEAGIGKDIYRVAGSGDTPADAGADGGAP